MECRIKITDIEFTHNGDGELLYVNVLFNIENKNKTTKIEGYRTIDAISYKGNESIESIKEIVRKGLI